MTFPNPLIPGFNPDPSATVVDGVYYLVTSTFEYVPGIPVYRSTDFANWEHIGNVVTSAEQAGIGAVPTGAGVWAPTIRHRDGVFYVIVTVAMGRGCVVYRATDPDGPWDDGIVLGGVEGIDPDLAWDENGDAVVTYSGLILSGEELGKHGGIRQVTVDLSDGSTISEPRQLWSGTGRKFPEAPHLYHRGEFWYLMIAEGGTERGHGVSIARGPTASGPFTGRPVNPFLSASGTNRPIQNTGHGDLVELTSGETVMVLLGVRPRGLTQAFSALGRETFVTSVRWEDDWPVAEPVELTPRAGVVEETFDLSAPLDDGWMAIRRAPGDFAAVSGGAPLVLRGEGTDVDEVMPVFLGRRQQHQTASFGVGVDATEGSGGLAVRYDEENTYSLIARRAGDTIVITARAWIAGLRQEWSIDAPLGRVELRLESNPPTGEGFGLWGQTSDLVRFVAVFDGEERLLATVDGRYLTSEVTASFTGRVYGIFAVDGTVEFDMVTYRGVND